MKYTHPTTVPIPTTAATRAEWIASFGIHEHFHPSTRSHPSVGVWISVLVKDTALCHTPRCFKLKIKNLEPKAAPTDAMRPAAAPIDHSHVRPAHP